MLSQDTGTAAQDQDAEQQWFVVHCQANAETKARMHLERQNYRVYLPQSWRERRHARRKEMVLRPLFPRYLFVSLDLSRDVWRPIISTVGVSTLVMRNGRPAKVPNGIVESLVASEQDGGLPYVDPALSYKEGDLLRVTQGPFADMVGQFISLSDDRRIMLLLEMLGRSVPARITSDHVERA